MSRRGPRLTFGPLLRGALFARRGRVLLAVAAIAIGTSVAAALLLVSQDVGVKVEHELRAYGPNLVVAPRAGELTLGNREVALGAVASRARLGTATRAWLDGEQAAGRLAGFVTLRYAVARRGDAPAVVAGTELAALAALNPTWRIEPAGAFVPGAAAGYDAIAGAGVARELGLASGDGATLEVTGERGPRPLGLTRIAIVHAEGPEDRQLFVRADRLAEALGEDSTAPFHVALARAGGPAAGVLAYAARPLPDAVQHEGASLRAVRRLSAGDGEVLRRLSLLLVTVTVVALIAAILCSMSTLTDLILERTREIALLRALGAGRHDLVRLFALEATALGGAGGLAGLAIGTVAAQAIGYGVFGTAIRFSPPVLPIIVALGIATALAASFLPVRRALAIEPAPVLRGE